MDNAVFSALIMVLIMFGVGLYISAPFMRRTSADMFKDDYDETPLHHLLSRKDSIYAAMRELEFDYNTGKLSDGDYESLQGKFAGEAAGVLEEIDVMTGKPKTKTKTKTSGKSAALDDAAESDKCGACGFVYVEGDKFCAGCGADLV